MGWTVLYIAFGIVALWLLGEVLLQYKARLRWRLLAFAGFSTVVAGVVALSSVIVIALGAAAFAVGQTFVTLSYRRGFSTGWALGGMPGSSRRRREGNESLEGEDAEPVLEVSGVEEHDPYGPQAPHGPQAPPGHDAYGAPGEAYEQTGYETSGYETSGYEVAYEPPTYEPQPLPDETGEYGIYDRGDPSVFEPAGYGGAGAGAGYGQQEQHQYAPYSDPYIGYDSGQNQYAATASYDAYGAGGGVDAGYGGYDGGYDAYGGAWVPQQREAEQAYGYGGYGEQPYGGGQSYGDQGYGADQTYAYGYPYAEAGYAAQDGYGNGNGYEAGAQGYDPAAGHYGYDEQRGGY